MELREAQEIVLCLPRERTLFRYFKDRYALYLLGRAAGTGAHVRELKASRYAPLLRRTPVRELAARTPDGILSRDLLESVWPAQPEAYRLRLGIWGAEEEWHYAQISRPGVSLVLRLDFSSRHDRAYRRYVKARPDVTFADWGHPASRRGITLAWARLDVDLARGEALIEEVQNDWLREVQWFERCVACSRNREQFVRRWLADETVKLHQVERYIDLCVRPHLALWDEAMLTATLWFLWEELGVRRVVLHDYQTGLRLKRMQSCPGPASLYRRLVRRFCFERTTHGPDFIEHSRDRRVRAALRGFDARWWELCL